MLGAEEPARLHWARSQSFENACGSVRLDGAPDLISSMAFSTHGGYLAVGDAHGGVVLFRADEAAADAARGSRERAPGAPASEPPYYRFLAEFQSHERELDTFASCDVPERINCVGWLPPAAAGASLLAANDRVIKLWRCREVRVPLRPPHHYGTFHAGSAAGAATGGAPRMPPRTPRGAPVPVVTEKRAYTVGHNRHCRIHSLAVGSDEQTFMSADETRVNLWSLERRDDCYCIVQRGAGCPSKHITCAALHPSDCALLAFGTMSGPVRVCDMRSSALCDTGAKRLASAPSPSGEVYTVSSVKFVGAGGHLLVRRGPTLRLWDVRSERGPIAVFEAFRAGARACDTSGDGLRFVTGSGRSSLAISDLSGGAPVSIGTVDSGGPSPEGRCGSAHVPSTADDAHSVLAELPLAGGAHTNPPPPPPPPPVERALIALWHPFSNCIAAASNNRVVIYTGSPASSDEGM